MLTQIQSRDLGFETIIVSMVAFAVFLLAQAFMVPTFGENAQARKRMKIRLQEMAADGETPGGNSLVREKYLRKLPAWAQWLESLPAMAALGSRIEQAGKETPAHRLVLLGAGQGLVGILAIFLLTHKPGLSVVAGVAAAGLPFFRLNKARGARLALFEEQFPDALSTMGRALKAGYPFSEAMKLVGEEMDEPVAKEFEITFNEINYGGDVKLALAGLLARIPSVTVMAFASAIAIQKETGGNLAELLDKLEKVIRARFKFRRTLNTLTAEGRLGAWIMSLFPFVLGGVLTLVNPDLMPMLLYDPDGQKLIMGAFVLVILGIIWMQRIVRIDV